MMTGRRIDAREERRRREADALRAADLGRRAALGKRPAEARRAGAVDPLRRRPAQRDAEGRLGQGRHDRSG